MSTSGRSGVSKEEEAFVTESETRVANKRYTAYKVVVKRKGGDLTLYKRYSEFLMMHEKLTKMFPKLDLKLPAKRRLGNNFDPTFIQERKKGLHVYLRQVVSKPEIVNSPPVREFLYGGTGSLSRDELLGDDRFDDETRDGNTNDEGGDDAMNLGESEEKGASLDDFYLMKVIGVGSFGKVLLAKHKETEQVFAIKVLSKKAIKQRDEVKHIMAERNVLLKNLKHPFLVGLHYSFQTREKLYFVLDYVNGGELFFHLQREKNFSEARTRFYASEITAAISFMHKQNIVYRDLKPENILLDRNGHIVLTDFGLCKENVQPGETTSTFCGTPEYLAPEVLRKQDYGRAVDWWCLGAVTYEMMVGLPPFYSRDVDEMYDKILNDRLRFPYYVSGAARELLIGLLERDPAARLGSSPADASEIKAAAFFAGIDWDKLERREYTPPFNPNVSDSMDLKHFDPEFINKPIPSSLMTGSGILDVEVDDTDATFAGFTYTGDSNLSEM